MKNIIQTLLFLIFIFGGMISCGMIAKKAVTHCTTYAQHDSAKFRKCINF